MCNAQKSRQREGSRKILIIITKAATTHITREIFESALPDMKFNISAVDSVIEKYHCRSIELRFPDPLPVPPDIQDEFGAHRMFILSFPENTSVNLLCEELLNTSQVEYAAPSPLHYAISL
jgi:hypothetical protein